MKVQSVLTNIFEGTNLQSIEAGCSGTIEVYNRYYVGVEAYSA